MLEAFCSLDIDSQSNTFDENEFSIIEQELIDIQELQDEKVAGSPAKIRDGARNPALPAHNSRDDAEEIREKNPLLTSTSNQRTNLLDISATCNRKKSDTVDGVKENFVSKLNLGIAIKSINAKALPLRPSNR
eukprot:CAMPEP_0113331090 /NCGR_PEP_ID=MMETSP0010_2-20120614/22254_1 /TAXON_ID=216773 ORGANISM="Corethron hystrix, Strain 308" /NCGR_SAMPLE_ID=MMETSP0010_2 /ASSEMBLY_ACC=CAM_ASM_000155 /LENGTH=132 /DNA_ID=CAMNT_0000194235 /DNA_START=96 /DNA_END=494 /DNA_ORIENTATION=- /assembly_acc=CAM_ASM_000155